MISEARVYELTTRLREAEEQRDENKRLLDQALLKVEELQALLSRPEQRAAA